MRKVKFNSTDNLAPIRDQLMDLVKPHSTVLELGCGNGDLLLKLSPRIKYGLGIDKSLTQIEFAQKQKKENNVSNVGFLCEALDETYAPSETYDYALASLFFHVIPVSLSIYLLKKMTEISDTVLVCEFSAPQTRQQKFLLWLDQRFSGHYENFRAYRKFGYMEEILTEAQCSNREIYETHIPFVKVYKINVLH